MCAKTSLPWWTAIRRSAALVALIVLVTAAAAIPPLPANADGHTVTCADLDPFDGLASSLAGLFPGQRFTAAVYDTRTECWFDLNPAGRITTASVLKIEIMAGVLLEAQDAGRSLTSGEDSLITPMISVSADPPASTLWLSLGGQEGMTALNARLGLIDTVAVSPWGATITSARDQVWLIRQLLLGEEDTFTDASSETARGYMENVVADQQWGITADLPPGWTHPMKNGFFPLTGRGWRINSVGFIDDPAGGGYAVAILSDGWATEAAGIDGVEFVAGAVNAHLAVEGLELVWEGTFRDDDASVHQGSIEALVAAGVTGGCNADGDRFCPADPVTRAQMASLLTRSLGLPPLVGSTFVDIDASPHAGAIEALVAEGVTAGCDAAADRYCPADPVTRGQMASFLVRALGWEPAGPTTFDDVSDSVHAGAIERLVAEGIASGCEPGVRYCPDEAVTRAQMASFLVRAFDL